MVVNALGRIWHAHCFTCVDCGKKLSVENFMERLGAPYCKDCYHRLFSPVTSYPFMSNIHIHTTSNYRNAAGACWRSWRRR